MILGLTLAATLFAFLYWLRGQTAEGARGPVASAAKTLSTACLALAGLAGGADPWLVAGLAFGSLGDFALTREGEKAFIAGLIAFAIGHILYIIAFLSGFGALQLPGPAGLAALALIAALPLSTRWWLLPFTGALCAPVTAYCLIIAATAAAALLIPGAPLIWWGVALFVASDILLALRIFRLQSPGARRAAALTLWPLYFGGQALILHGAL